MAANPSPATPNLEETLDIVEKFIECPICCDICNPLKQLPCHMDHTFCTECLKKQAREEGELEVRCFYCSKTCPLPPNGIVGLPEHRGTNARHLRVIQNTLEKYKGLSFQDSLEKARKGMTDNQEALKVQINNFAESLIAMVKNKQQALITQLEETTEKKSQKLSEKEEWIKRFQTNLSECLSAVNVGLQNEVMQVVEPEKNVQQLESEFPPSSLVVQTPDKTKVAFSQVQRMEEFQNFGQLYEDPVCPQKCTLQRIQKLIFIHKEATLILQTYDHYGQKNECTNQQISCDLEESDGTSTASGTVEKTGTGQYKLSYTAPRRGCYQLHIKVEGQHIQDSPFTVAAVNDFTTEIKVIDKLIDPWGVAINTSGDIIVAECGGHTITIFNRKREQITSFSSYPHAPHKPPDPQGVLVLADNSIVVSDGEYHCIHMFSPSGEYRMTRGKEGNGTTDLEFNSPTGIGVHPTNGRIYIADSFNNRVQVLDAELRLITMFGEKGYDDGQFVDPYDISFDSTGNCYVADASNHRVQVFSENGEYIRQFGKKGTGEGEIGDCTSIAIESDIVYIADENNSRISLFTTDGCFLTSFGKKGKEPGQFDRPYGICVDNSGQVYVSDHMNDRIQVFGSTAVVTE